jgi:hypothetical protein
MYIYAFETILYYMHEQLVTAVLLVATLSTIDIFCAYIEKQTILFFVSSLAFMFFLYG